MNFSSHYRDLAVNGELKGRNGYTSLALIEIGKEYVSAVEDPHYISGKSKHGRTATTMFILSLADMRRLHNELGIYLALEEGARAFDQTRLPE